MDNHVSTLVEMGFDAQKASSALLATGNQGVDRAVEWYATVSVLFDLEMFRPCQLIVRHHFNVKRCLKRFETPCKAY